MVNLKKVMTWLPIFAVASLLFFFSTNANACSCIAPNTVRDFNEAQHVFLAQIKEVIVVRAGHEATYDPGEVNGLFDVVKTFKGEPAYVTHLVAQHKPNGGMCGETLAQQLYLVFAQSDGTVGVSLCSPTKVATRLSPNKIDLIERLANSEQAKYMNGVFDAETGLLTLEGSAQGQPIFEGRLGVYEGRHSVEFEGYQLTSGDLVISQVITINEQAMK